MSMLGYYINQVNETKGLERQANLANLRNYIKTTPTRQLIENIEMIGKPIFLRILWEAGLKLDLQEAVLRKQTELTERQT